MPDDKTRAAQLARIRALLERTTANGCTEAEAATAAAAVDRLLAQYELDLDDVATQAQEVVRLDIAALKHPVRHMALAIGRFCDCKVWSDQPNIVFLGLEIDTEIAEYLVTLFMRAIDRETGNFTVFNADYALRNAAGQADMVTSFQVGITTRLGERLAHLKSSRDFSQKTGGFDLVLAKGAIVERAFGTLGISLGGRSAGASIRDNGAYHAGRSAAERVAINQGVGRNATTSTRAIG